MSGNPGGTWPGFWLPAHLRARLLSPSTQWDQACFAQGRECGKECDPDRADAVAARWPRFTEAQWAELFTGLRAAREDAPQGPEYWERLQRALAVAARRLADAGDFADKVLLRTLSGYTGYSTGMIAATVGGPDLWDVGKVASALRYRPSKACGVRWQKMPGMPGRIRFFPGESLGKIAGWLPVAWEMPLYQGSTRPRTVIGFGEESVPGGPLLLVLLALSMTLQGESPARGVMPPPVVLVGNSKREPVLTPVVLSALEEVDPELVSMVAVTVWDQDDRSLLRRLLAEGDLVLAAAGHDLVADLSTQIDSVPGERRLHPHRPKVSFTVISRETLEPAPPPTRRGQVSSGPEVIDVVSLLAGLDSAFWDQNGCLSSRVHFVEQGGPADDLPAEYARRLTERMRQIAEVVPRGAWPVRRLHDPFDRYKALEGSSRWGTGLQVLSDYDDPFVVIFDGRTGPRSRPDRETFVSLLDECRTRVIVVRPVRDIMEVPWTYLEMLPRSSLQSLGVAVGRPGEGLTKPFLDFATACGNRGVTAIRSVGRAAFPQLAYSWDGFIPLDLAGRRPPGYFATIEFDSPFDEMMQTYHSHLSRLARIPAAVASRPH